MRAAIVSCTTKRVSSTTEMFLRWEGHCACGCSPEAVATVSTSRQSRMRLLIAGRKRQVHRLCAIHDRALQKHPPSLSKNTFRRRKKVHSFLTFFEFRGEKSHTLFSLEARGTRGIHFIRVLHSTVVSYTYRGIRVPRTKIVCSTHYARIFCAHTLPCTSMWCCQ